MPKQIEITIVKKKDFFCEYFETNSQNKRNANPKNIPPWTILSKYGIKDKNPISFGNESVGANIPNSINPIQRTKRTKFIFLFPIIIE